MKDLFNRTDANEIIARIQKLTPDSEGQWGKMTVNQMVPHCNASLETAMGLTVSKRVGFFVRIIGKLLKPQFLGEKPFPKNSSTDPTYIITGNPDLETEKAKVIQHIKMFSEGGPAKCTKHPQAFFGPLTPQEWAIMQWKHFDHHLRQFGC